MVNLTSLHLPAYFYGQGLFVALEREILDGSGLATRKRRQRGIVELTVGGYGAGVSTVNALDIAEISEEIEVMKGQMRAAVKDIYQDAETATDLSQQVNQLVWRELKQLQPYQITINELIDRQSAISKEVYSVQSCNMYATYLLQSLQVNLLQLTAHRVPDWVSNDQLMAWVKTAHQAPEHLSELTLASHVPFANDNHTLLVGMMLHISRVGANSTHELLQVNNLGHYGNGVLVKLKDAPEHAIQRAGGIFSIDLQSITIGRHELTPYRDVSIVEADDLERTDDDQQIHRYVQKGLPCILHLRACWEGLKKEAM
ncbi:hypothetical protein scyTo_0000590 [Scyliorhinus torazame]|uniref:Uncharacterized protein n=1 Tax=Scyliorhinus torazame TaxID=75743 RepID=A0A401NZX2_SCYTO|nr:hypothetical protein [Scyliorhinus torazame]